MIDSHTHLCSCKQDDAELVGDARALGVTRILTVGMTTETCEQSMRSAESFDEVYFAAGRHPNLVNGYDCAVTDELREFAAHPKCVAIGETGLDFFRDSSDPADQALAFSQQIQLAGELNKPLIIHTRNADEQTITTLKEEAKGVQVILHCFSMADRVEECVQQGWMISFAGNVTYPSAADLAQACTRVPDSQLLLETDAPYLTPQSKRRERNMPCYVTETAKFVAQMRQQSYETVDRLVTANAARVFGW